ncbi:hypothetical protein ACS0TY_027364 [Phlomoides rotata]
MCALRGLSLAFAGCFCVWTQMPSWSPVVCGLSFLLLLQGPLVYITRMERVMKGKEVDLGFEGIVRLEEEENFGEAKSTPCLIGKVLSNKPFNAFGLLEAMNPPRGFTTREIEKNLFSFQFRSESNMQSVLSREPWMFDKNVLLLKELWGGEQPSVVSFQITTFWVRLYDLPTTARTTKVVHQIGGIIGETVEIYQASMEEVARSIRVKVKINFQKPLKRGIQLEIRDKKPVWVEFKYERLPSFRYVYGMLGHMRRECDLAMGWMKLKNYRRTNSHSENG